MSPRSVTGADPTAGAPTPTVAPPPHLNGSGPGPAHGPAASSPEPTARPLRREADTAAPGAPTEPRRDPDQPPVRPDGAPSNGAPFHASPASAPGPERNGQCTAPQLRRFIKSRPYVPMHELRRRFAIDGDDDDVTSVKLDPGWVYVGLPNREGLLLGDLLRAGEIGYELSLDPRTPIVIGVYPMRPIPRG
ncbi:MAG TPA: hypothetical protein VGQ31_04255 [Candidatus Limnocylindrales bacterium]|jgi:hypothetical protein|nr:hypothetical protein [Candidatus Limnocylindrales bacterium]